MCIIIVGFILVIWNKILNRYQSQQLHNEGLINDDHRLNITPDNVIMLFQTCTIADQFSYDTLMHLRPVTIIKNYHTKKMKTKMYKFIHD